MRAFLCAVVGNFHYSLSTRFGGLLHVLCYIRGVFQ